ncbi:MAG: response regulator, partial [Desulfuromonadaceae bacterium]|nr:response regulator [Desulfuromonadaceae bacterium]
AMLDGKKVLVVDDDMRNIFSLSSALQEKNIIIYEAENGVEALKCLDENPDINLVLMDIMMPEMDGYVACRAIRDDPRFRTLPVIALTAKAMKGDREECLNAGASDYIPKPLDMDKLFSLLRVWLYSTSNGNDTL